MHVHRAMHEEEKRAKGQLTRLQFFIMQIGSGASGLSIGSFGLNWNTVAGFHGNPLVSPAFAIFNVMVGFVLTTYVAVPLLYRTDTYNAKRFSLVSSHVFNAAGGRYDTDRILDPATFTLNLKEYDAYRRINLSVLFAINYIIGFVGLMSTLFHVLLYHGKQVPTLN
ncbi:hypothetical protein E2562_035048 [Oryza meyeriana var. granulata]|uniref:Uncharacterized protein n=1 Tax=Oryza meyeriana var. granulata TaxID=110450 RepID=A0A6G1CJW7_9ORYZ|nr:hypothetical protein E2562_035048 [Oryza meyeriana var. granulata]